MEKLKFEHLAPYLPYKLKCNLVGMHVEGSEYDDPPIAEIFIIEGANTKLVEVWSNKTITDGWNYDEVFPILRPPANLTKEIEVNGEKFIPIVELAKLAGFGYNKEYKFIDCGIGTEDHESWCYFIYDLKYKNFYNSSGNNFDGANDSRVENNFELMNKLYEWHFDIEGLINAGLAIDINTFNNN